MALLSVTLITLEEDGSNVKIPIISPEPLAEIVKTLSHKWNIIRVTSNDGSFSVEVKDGEVLQEKL